MANDHSGIRMALFGATGVDAVCFCLGVAASQVSGEDEYRRITHDYAPAAARALKAASPQATFHFLSGAGTKVTSRMMWARVKGETEIALQKLGLGGIVCWRPAMILSPKPPPGLPWSYRVMYPVMRALRFAKSLSCRSEELGQAMLEATLAGRRDGVVDNREIRDAARRYREELASRT